MIVENTCKTKAQEQAVLMAEDTFVRCGVTVEEILVLCRLSREMKLGDTPWHLSFLSMAQSVEKLGAPQLDKMLEIALTNHAEDDAVLQLYGWIHTTITGLVAEVNRGRNEGDAKRDFRERIAVYLHRMYPGATPATIALTVGQSFLDTPGTWTFHAGRVVLALRNLKRI